jgi:hypothetical protein
MGSERETSLGIEVSAARSRRSQTRCGLAPHPRLEARSRSRRYRRSRRRSYSGSRRRRRGESPGGETQQSHGEADGSGATPRVGGGESRERVCGIQVSECRAPPGKAPSGRERSPRLGGARRRAKCRTSHRTKCRTRQYKSARRGRRRARRQAEKGACRDLRVGTLIGTPIGALMGTPIGASPPDRCQSSGARRQERDEALGGEGQQSHGEADGGGATREPAAASPGKGLRL